MLEGNLGAQPHDGLDRNLRARFHDPLEVVEDTDTGLAFRADVVWMTRIEAAHEYLVDLTQLFYDFSPLIDDRTLSTTAFNEIKKKLISCSWSNSEYSYWSSTNREVFELFSSRHKLLLGQPDYKRAKVHWSRPGKDANWLTIRDKANWAKKQVAQVRRENDDLRADTSARQADFIAQGFARALRKRPDERKAALDELRNQIYVDTRSKRGYPQSLAGLPVIPNPHARAWLQHQGGKWKLWIERSGIPDSALASLRDTECPYRLRNPLCTAATPSSLNSLNSSEDIAAVQPHRRPPRRAASEHREETNRHDGPGWETQEMKELFGKWRSRNPGHTAPDSMDREPANPVPTFTGNVLSGFDERGTDAF
jgi:hypothetical protein